LDEWELLDNFVPLFEGHERLAEPLGGRYDDANISTAERQIREAAEHGISAFTYFTFHTGTRFVLDQPAQSALQAASQGGFAVAATWCLRLPHQFLPIPQSYDQRGLSVAGAALDQLGEVWSRLEGWTIERLENTFGRGLVGATTMAGIAPLMGQGPAGEAAKVEGLAMQRTYRLNALAMAHFIDAWVDKFASQPNYMRFNGRPVLSVLNIPDFAKVYGLEGLRLILSLARRITTHALGVPPYVIGLVTAADDSNVALARGLPLDAVTGYGLLPEWDGPPVQHYAQLVERRVREWYRVQSQLDVPFFPVVCSGWDATVRGGRVSRLDAVRGFPWRPVVIGASPERFAHFLDAAIKFNRATKDDDIVFLHAWNEWTEGAAIEPNTKVGHELIEHVRRRAEGSVVGPW